LRTGPPDLGFRLLKSGQRRLLTDAAGAVRPDPTGHGLYAGDTRYLCRLELSVGGRRPTPVDRAGTLAGPGDTDRIELSAPGPADLQVIRRRTLGTGLVEQISLASRGRRTRRATVRLVVGFDAADIFEIRGYRRPDHGELLPVRVDGPAVHFAYLGLDLRLRALDLAVQPQASRSIVAGSRRRGRELNATIRWDVELAPGASTELSWSIETNEIAVSDRRAALAAAALPAGTRDRRRRRPARPEAEVEIDLDRSPLQPILDRSLADLRLLAEDGPGAGDRMIAAGLPWFAALFGRDSLLTAFEAIAFRPDLAVDALAVLARHQARAGDRRGGEPGQILHELRTGEMARLGEVPFGPSYGSVDATPLWLILLGEANDWLADPVLVDRLWPAALRALGWLDARLALDQGQFLRYAGRPGALANEGWKDSPDAVRDRVGATVPAPIALAEVQGYLYDAWRRLARLARERGEAPLAIGLDRRASRLRVRFRAAFWISDRSFPAMALGRQDRVADSIASNAGQCLWSGILTAPTAAAVARRILADDMDSGWGIRTLAAGEPAFDPRGYHTGSVWPHDTALIAGGLKRAGFDAAAIKLADQLFEAALAVPASRLPELLSGEARVPGAGPGLVAGACPVQAWASAAPLHLVRSLLGLEPDARAARLVLRRPRLPGAVDRIRIRGLSVGARQLDLEVSRSRSGVRAAHIGGDPAIRLVRLG
jgi:glycogen debranching enzyme